MSIYKLSQKEKTIICNVKRQLSEYGAMLAENDRLRKDIEYYNAKMASVKSTMSGEEQFFGSRGAADDGIVNWLDKKRDKEELIRNNLERYSLIGFSIDSIDDELEKRIITDVWVKKVCSIEKLSDELMISYSKLWLVSRDALIKIDEIMKRLME